MKMCTPIKAKRFGVGLFNIEMFRPPFRHHFVSIPSESFHDRSIQDHLEWSLSVMDGLRRNGEEQVTETFQNEKKNTRYFFRYYYLTLLNSLESALRVTSTFKNDPHHFCAVKHIQL